MEPARRIRRQSFTRRCCHRKRWDAKHSRDLAESCWSMNHFSGIRGRSGGASCGGREKAQSRATDRLQRNRCKLKRFWLLPPCFDLNLSSPKSNSMNLWNWSIKASRRMNSWHLKSSINICCWATDAGLWVMFSSSSLDESSMIRKCRPKPESTC